jgi:hypothetical protein
MSIEDRVAQLEERLRQAEDRLEIIDLLNRYGPLADSGASAEAAALWVEGGGYNYSGGQSGGTRLEAPDALVAVYEGAGHQGLIARGSAHLTATPAITLDGDRARAVGYTFLILREGERWFVLRAAVNEWTLVRTGAGWRIEERFNRTLTGSAESREVMRRIIPR